MGQEPVILPLAARRDFVFSCEERMPVEPASAARLLRRVGRLGEVGCQPPAYRETRNHDRGRERIPERLRAMSERQSSIAVAETVGKTAVGAEDCDRSWDLTAWDRT